MKKWLVVFTALCLLLLIILPACGGNGEDETPTPTSTPVITATPTAIPTVTATATPTPTTSKPVKIGALGPWSGPIAMSGQLADQIIAVVEMQVKDMGGILGGRELKFIRGDDRGVIAESVGQAKKLILDDKVSIITLGGVSMAGYTAVAEVTEELKVPFVAMGTIQGSPSKNYTAYLMGNEATIGRIANFVADYLKPRTVAFLTYESKDGHQLLDGLEGTVGARERWKAKGISIISEQYFPLDSMDLSPYLTKIKYENPDVVVTELNNLGQAIAINKQIMELGGWGDIKVFHGSSASSNQKVVSMPAALGTYVSVEWLAGSDDPGMNSFENAFEQKYNRQPASDMAYYYNCFWTALKAIELAGTDDPVKVGEALRSGKIEWDSAWGHMRIDTDGMAIFDSIVTQAQEGGKLVKVWP